MTEHLPKPNSLRENVKVEVDWSKYATEIDFKNVSGVDTSSFAKKLIQLIQSTYVNNDLDGEEIAGTFYELQEVNQKEFRV